MVAGLYSEGEVKGAAEGPRGPVAVVIDKAGELECVEAEAVVSEALGLVVCSGASPSLSDMVASAASAGRRSVLNDRWLGGRGYSSARWGRHSVR